MTKVFNQSSQKEKRRLLRQNATRAEIILWRQLKNKQILDYKFRRQYSVGPFVIDFYCPQKKLAIEIDGDSHYWEGMPQYDKNRQEHIESLGIQFLRFTNIEIYKNLQSVIESIKNNLKRRELPPLNPLLDKERTCHFPALV